MKKIEIDGFSLLVILCLGGIILLTIVGIIAETIVNVYGTR